MRWVVALAFESKRDARQVVVCGLQSSNRPGRNSQNELNRFSFFVRLVGFL